MKTAKFPPITDETFRPWHLMRTWSKDGFLVELFETGFTDYERYGHTYVAYRFYDVDYAFETGNADPIFAGTDYGIPSGQTIDGDHAVRGILGFLSIRPGDTDAEFFDGYTERQLAWVDARAEELNLWGLDDTDLVTGLEIGGDE